MLVIIIVIESMKFGNKNPAGNADRQGFDLDGWDIIRNKNP